MIYVVEIHHRHRKPRCWTATDPQDFINRVRTMYPDAVESDASYDSCCYLLEDYGPLMIFESRTDAVMALRDANLWCYHGCVEAHQTLKTQLQQDNA